MAAFLLAYVVNDDIDDVAVTACFAFYLSMSKEKEQYRTTNESFITAAPVVASTAADN